MGSGFILLFSEAEQTFKHGYYCLPHPLPPCGKGKGEGGKSLFGLSGKEEEEWV